MQTTGSSPSPTLKKSRSKLTRIVGVIGMVVAGFGGTLLMPGQANADGTYRWQNVWTGGYLEIWQSSTSDGARVITWPYNASSLNQWWTDYKQSDGYYRLVNYNSGKSLDRYDPPGSGEADCSVYQYYWTGQSWQHWRIASAWSNSYGRYFDQWINKAGCNGNVYWDHLTSSSNGDSASLDYSDHCEYDMGYPQARCWWKRNGV
ncbi:RICIN domain-containing protein [Microbispora sp. NPDC049633]|uniref:RICIN domain-containing protein n=1 Tax=Microbispora sp. NPDC049633 TaxID=3154355 RepID=UPI00343DCAB4